jgi:hypothetical protein
MDTSQSQSILSKSVTYPEYPIKHDLLLTVPPESLYREITFVHSELLGLMFPKGMRVLCLVS